MASAATGVAVVYSNFGLDHAYDAQLSHGWAILGDRGPGTTPSSVAEQFTPNGSYSLQDVRIATTQTAGNAGFLVSLQRDSLGAPGGVLESIPVPPAGSVPAIVVAHSRLAPVLLSGVPYWVSVTAAAPLVAGGWNWNSIGDLSTSNFAYSQSTDPLGPWTVGGVFVRSVFEVTGANPAPRGQTLTLDEASLPTPLQISIDEASITYAATISNRGQALVAGISLESWIEQPGARRAGGAQLVACGAARGVLPQGTCVATAFTLTASNSNAGSGQLVPGPARVVVQLVQRSGTDVHLLDTKLYSARLFATTGSVISVDVSPTHAEPYAPGVVQQLTASVVTTGGAPKTVTWSSSNPAAAVVSSSGLVTAIGPGATLVTATSTFDPTKSGTSLISVEIQGPSFGNGVNISPALWAMPIGSSFQFVAQVVNGAQAVDWFVNPFVGTVTPSGVVTAVAPGLSNVRATSQADPSKYVDADVEVFELLPSLPNSPTLVSTGATNPPAHPLSVTLMAEALTSTRIVRSPLARVGFEVLVGSTWTPVATSWTPQIVDMGTNRFFRWIVTWTPGSAFGVGPQSFRAVGYDFSGFGSISSTNTFITITDP